MHVTRENHSSFLVNVLLMFCCSVVVLFVPSLPSLSLLGNPNLTLSHDLLFIHFPTIKTTSLIFFSLFQNFFSSSSFLSQLFHCLHLPSFHPIIITYHLLSSFFLCLNHWLHSPNKETHTKDRFIYPINQHVRSRPGRFVNGLAGSSSPPV